MRKNSSQNQTQKGAENPTSPRLTLRFQSIRSRDDKSSSSAAKISDSVSTTSTSHTKYQSYCVTMETKSDVYDFHKDDAVVSSTQNHINSSEETRIKCDTISSTSSSKETEENFKENSEKISVSELHSSIEKMEISDNVQKANGGRSNSDASAKEKEYSSDVEKEENRRKRRKSNDSIQSRHSTARGHKSPSNKSQPDSHNDQKSPKARKRNSLSSSDTESDAEPASADMSAESGNMNGGSSASASPHSPKVPPLKIVIPSGTTGLELETSERNKVSSSKQALPYVVNTTSSETMGTDSISGSFSGENMMSKSDMSSKSKDDNHASEEQFPQRVTRRSQRMQAASSSGASSSQCHSSESVHSNVVSSSSQKNDASGESSNDEQLQAQVDVHPRKRRLRTNKDNAAAEGGSHNPSCASSSSEDSQQQHQSLNCYQMYLNIRHQVDKKRRAMFMVQPKPPNGYENYLMNRKSYVLEGNAASRLSVPMISPPQSLEGKIKELFIDQEKERYKLRLQHLIEREKLVLSVEQEVLRVHGRAARAMSNQTTPLSVCSILKDEEIYNTIEDDKDKNPRSRYNGRLFLSWLQDVDDKWEKIKGNMLLRHHNEAESLHAVQKLDWEWKMKELGLCEMKSSPVIDDISVPMVHVNDDFELLPRT